MIGRKTANHLQNIIYIFLDLGITFMWCIQSQFHLRIIFYRKQLDSVIHLFINISNFTVSNTRYTDIFFLFFLIILL